MAKSGTQGQRDRRPQGPSVFLGEENRRSVLGNGKQVMPRPTFTQPDNGTFTSMPGSLGPHFDPTSRPMKVGNAEHDLHGGLW